jgi:hypothetical protein
MGTRHTIIALAALWISPCLAGTIIVDYNTRAELNAKKPQQLIERYHKSPLAQREAIVDLLMDKRADSIIALRNTVTSGITTKEKVFACKLLMEMRDRGAVRTLLQATETPEKVVRIHAINALREIGDVKAAPKFRKFLEAAPDNETLICSIYGLGKLGNKSDIKTLRGYLDKSQAIVKTSAAVSCAMLGEPNVLNILLEMTGNEDPLVSKMAVQGLGFINTPESAARLRAILNDPNAMWRNYAQISLKQQKLTSLRSEPERIQLLSGLSYDSNKWISEWAVKQLADRKPQALKELQKVKPLNPAEAKKTQQIMRMRGIK